MSETATQQPPALPPSPPEPHLTVRQRRYKKNRLKRMSQEDAAIAAGYSQTYASRAAFKIERLVNSGIIAELNRAGSTDYILAKELTAIGTAVTEEAVTVQEKLRALETIAKLKKHLNDQPIPPPVNLNFINLDIKAPLSVVSGEPYPGEIVIDPPEISMEPHANGNGASE